LLSLVCDIIFSCGVLSLFFLFAIVVVGVLIAILVAMGLSIAAAYRSKPISIVVQSSVAVKQQWMNQMATAFNSQRYELVRNKGFYAAVSIVHTTYHTLNATLHPILYAPVHQEWLNEDPILASNYFQTNKTCVSTTAVPVGIAMWRNMAESLGWPITPISFKDLMLLATEGWSRFGRQQAYGQTFKWGHGNLLASNTGRLTMNSMLTVSNHISANNSLQLSDVYTTFSIAATRNFSRTISNTQSMHETDLLNMMVTQGPSFLHAVTTYESNVIDVNLKYGSKLQLNGLVMIYPSDGIYFMNNPVCLVDGPQSALGTSSASDKQRDVYEVYYTGRAAKKHVEHWFKKRNEIQSLSTYTCRYQ